MERRFAPVGRRGYDKAEVTAFLAEVAEALESARAEAKRSRNDISFEHLGLEAGAVLKTAKEGAEQLRRRAEQEAEATLRSANYEAQELRRRAKEETDELRRSAAAEAEELRRTAREETDELRRRVEEETTAKLEEATREAERRVREAEVVTRRLRNVTKRQCDQMVADAQARAERLQVHQREMRKKISDIEAMFQAFRAEMEKLDAEQDVERDDGEALSVIDLSDDDGPRERKGAGVQPKPIFGDGSGV